MNHPWDLFADFIGRTIAQRWAASRTISPIAPGGAEPAPSSADQKLGTMPCGKAEHAPRRTNSRSKEADMDPY